MEPPIKLVELFDMSLPEPEYLVDKLIPEGAITIISGTSGSYKSYACLDMAIAIAEGKPAFGHFETKKTGVMYIDEENGLRLLKKRLEQLGADRNLDIYFQSYKGFVVNEDNIDNLIWDCTTNNVGLVIFDSLVRVNQGDENNARDMAAFFRLIKNLVYKDISVVLIHHNRKPGSMNAGAGNEMRGSSDIHASIDSHVGFKRAQQRITVTQTKLRTSLEASPFWLKVEGNDENVTLEYQGDLLDSHDTELDTEVLIVLRDGELSQKDVLTALKARDGVKVNEHNLRNLLKVMVAEGQLQVSSGAGNTKLYAIKHEGDGSESS